MWMKTESVRWFILRMEIQRKKRLSTFCGHPGDSATVGMKKYGGGNHVYIGKQEVKDTNGFYKRDKDLEKSVGKGSAVQGHY